MDTESMALNDVDDIEEGEISDTSEEIYTSLQRPTTLIRSSLPSATSNNLLNDDTKSINNLDDEDQSDDYFSSSGDSSDTFLDKTKNDKLSKRRKRHLKRTIMVRIQPNSDSAEQQNKVRFKKYDIWSAALQEEALTENMRGCDVTQNAFNCRNVENYDFPLKYRLNGENRLKRRRKRQLSNSSSKREEYESLGKRKDVCGRRRKSASDRDSNSSSYSPKHIEDLEDVEGREAVDVAKEMAMKLHEEKDELLVRIITILGTELPLKVYQETQRIEAKGGMTIKNGERRRTPGGVFLLLLKHHELLSAEDRKAIFSEDRNVANKKQKDLKTSIRDRKVEELKKRLCEQGAEMPSLSTRKELMLLDEEANQKTNDANLSNPPPSPEVYEPNELALATAPINHVTNEVEPDLSDKPTTSRAIDNDALQTYEDDCLDVNCGDMDFF